MWWWIKSLTLEENEKNEKDRWFLKGHEFEQEIDKI